MLWLYDMSTIGLAGLFAAVFVGFAWLGILFIRPFFRLLLRRQPGDGLIDWQTKVSGRGKVVLAWPDRSRS
jgi:hypothetical protein